VNPLRQAYFGPSPDLIAHGSQVYSAITFDPAAPGAIFTADDRPRWRFEPNPKRSAWSVRNIFKKPDFVVFDPDAHEVLRVRRKRRVPPQFEMVQDNRPVGEIALRSVFRNTYAITLAGGSTWLFRMPLFAVTFHGESQDGRQVWVRVGPRKTRWNILLDASLDHLHLLAALAFIHREWWCYS